MRCNNNSRSLDGRKETLSDGWVKYRTNRMCKDECMITEYLTRMPAYGFVDIDIRQKHKYCLREHVKTESYIS